MQLCSIHSSAKTIWPKPARQPVATEDGLITTVFRRALGVALNVAWGSSSATAIITLRNSRFLYIRVFSRLRILSWNSSGSFFGLAVKAGFEENKPSRRLMEWCPRLNTYIPQP